MKGTLMEAIAQIITAISLIVSSYLILNAGGGDNKKERKRRIK